MAPHFSHHNYKGIVCAIFTGLVIFSFISACFDNSRESEEIFLSNITTESNSRDGKTESSSSELRSDKHRPSDTTTMTVHDRIQKNIIYGRATLADVYTALTQDDVGALTNVAHALYNMRRHRGVYNLAHDIWANAEEKHPDLAWHLIRKAPVRIALASTLNRIDIINTDDYLEYIRSHKEDKHEFHLAQVVLALGFNGETIDIEYISKMADGDNHYVSQSAITALALMQNNQARDALAKLWKKHQDEPRGNLIKQLLEKVYNVVPSLDKKTTTSEVVR